ncbi:MAG: aromatic ring-hydroxylating dioxygenase subunit alpha [Planctomycetes bacterium]|nr:aromatic ring-hydroxylating dioxygenase subunit alpha [Planctomycetota bacterium]
MFLHETHLPQVLTPDEYTSPDQYRRELERLLVPGWHSLCTLGELPNDGDWRTDELYGRPLILWRRGDDVKAFLNVCPHRFARIAGAKCGHAAEHLKCQYHGWEFDADGCTRKIPDARSFKPMSKGALELTKIHAEVCGQLVWVNLSHDAPPLAEYLGPGYERCQTLCAPGRRVAAIFDNEIDCNWKLKIENSLESYHVEMVHASTFGRTPPAELCRHELEPRWTTYATYDDPPTPWQRFLDRLVHRLVRIEPDTEYKQYLYYPNIMFGKMRLFSWAETVVPLSPTRTRIIARFFSHGSRSGRLRSRLLSRMLANWARKYFTRVGAEDAGIVQEVQRGLSSTKQPDGGLISIREERCWHFQEYIKEMTNDPMTNDQRERAQLTRKQHS